jgi:acylphosphatase
MRLARVYLVSGRVQGVGFRWFIQEAATVEGLHGWVRNLSDGRVEIRAEGDAEALDRFEGKVYVGPRGSRVEEIDTTDVGASGHDTGFTVR